MLLDTPYLVDIFFYSSTHNFAIRQDGVVLDHYSLPSDRLGPPKQGWPQPDCRVDPHHH